MLALLPLSSLAEEPASAPSPTPLVQSATGTETPNTVATTEQLAGQPQLSQEDLLLAQELQARTSALGEAATDEQVAATVKQFITEKGLTAEFEQAFNQLQALGSPEPALQVEPEAMLHDLSPWGMYQNADIVVKAVMIGLVLASILTWTVWLAKSIELITARRRLSRELQDLKSARTLQQAADQPRDKNSVTTMLIEDARDELHLSSNSKLKDGIKDRVSFRLERLVAACGRDMTKGTGVLATIGSTAPFVGLFGTVWGIMNSFIGIAKSQTTNLAVVAPGIAEALLATAIGLVAAIPAVIIYNVFARSITSYKAQVGDASAQVLLMVSRDLDTGAAERPQASPVVRAV
jgi:biopolymer transport protein ExbB